MEKKLLAYVRQSKKGNSEYSLPVQEKAIRAFVQARSLPEIEKLFHEEASAKTGLDEEEWSTTRGEFKQLLDLLKEDSKNGEGKKYAGVIFFDISRISRNASDFVAIENLMKQGYQMYSVRENIVDSPAGLYFFRMAQIEAIYYSERQSSKIRMYRYHKIKSDNSAWTGGRSPAYWYMTKKQWKNGTNEDNDDEQSSELPEWYEYLFSKKSTVLLHPVNSEIVRRIFELAKDGMLHASIYTKLSQEFQGKVDKFNNNSNHRDHTKASIPEASAISDILHNDNEFRYNGRRIACFNIKFEEDASMLNMDGNIPGNKKLRKWNDNEVEIFVPELRIIDDDLYKIAVDKMERRNLFKESRTRDPEKVPLFWNLIKCSCWAHITGNSMGKGFWYACASFRQKKPDSCPFWQKYHEKDIIDFLSREVFWYLRLAYIEDELLNEYIREQDIKLRKNIGENQAILTAYLKEIQEFEDGKMTKQQMKLGEKRLGNLKDELVPKTETKLNEKIQELASLKEWHVKERIEWLRKSLPKFESMSRLDQKIFIDLVIKSIIMSEVHDGEHFYKETNGTKNGTARQQKVVQEIKFNEPFQKILLYNKYLSSL